MVENTKLNVVYGKNKEKEEIYIICAIEEDVPVGNYIVLLNETTSFDYGDYRVNLVLGQGQEFIKFEKVDKYFIDLYSDKETIIIIDNVDSYDLKFNIVSYHQEQIYFDYDFCLEDCTNKNNILICTLT